MVVRNLTRDTLLGGQIDVADTSAKRRTGLLKHTGLERGAGLWIVPCEGVHMFGMKFAIDVVFLNKQKQVVKVRPNLGKWGMSFSFRAKSVLELPVGTIESTGTQVGDQLEMLR
jgi:uncharacterized protein